MTNQISNIFSRNNVLNALLALSVAIEFVYDCGERFGTWYRNGGREQLIKAVAVTVAAIIWTYETVRLGAESVRTNAPQWIAQANATRHQIGRAFSYEYTAS